LFFIFFILHHNQPPLIFIWLVCQKQAAIMHIIYGIAILFYIIKIHENKILKHALKGIGQFRGKRQQRLAVSGGL